MSASRLVLRRATLAATFALFASLAPGLLPPAGAVGPNPNETVDVSLTATQLAQALVGPGVTVTNATLVGAGSAGHFTFTDPAVVGFAQGLVLSSGNAADVVGPNTADDWSTPWYLDGDADLTALAGYPTYDAAVLQFDFVPSANQVTFRYVFASDEYSEYVNTPFNDVFAFFVNGVNYAVVRQVAGDPLSPFVPVAVNNINNSNPGQVPIPPAMRPDLFRGNSFNPAGPSPVDLESDGLTDVLVLQAPVNPGVTNHMKLAIADASDWILDSAVFIEAGSLVSNHNPVADLSLFPETGAAPLAVTAYIEGEDPDGASLTYAVNWGDGTAPSTGPIVGETATATHIYVTGGGFIVTLTVSNGTLSGTDTDDVHVTGTSGVAPAILTQPTAQTVVAGSAFSFSASASGVPAPSVRWQVSIGNGAFADIPGATATTYGGTAAIGDDGNRYRAVFTNPSGTAITDAALLTVTAPDTTPPVLAPTFTPAPPFLRGQTGIAVSPNATDASGIASTTCGAVDTSSVGLKSLTCTATDNAGNTGSATVTYLVGFGVTNVSPAAGASLKRTGPVPVSFQLRDASGVLSDAEAQALRPAVTVTFDGVDPVIPRYDKKTHAFDASLKPAKPAPGPHQIQITVVSGGTTVASLVIPVVVVA